MPDDIYLTLEANAAVTQASRTRRVLIVGVPLLHILSERELRGVIAHEFGHYSGGDTRLGPWIYRTRETIGRTIGQLSSEDDDESWSQRAVRQPFIWYGHAFLRITAAISRRQEFAADACAVRSVGRAAHVAALERIHAYAPGFDAYWQQEVIPVLQAGRRPPVSEGFRRFITHESADRAAKEQLAIMREEATDPYDSHPSLPERIAAVDGMPDGEPDDSPAAIALLASPDEVERRLLDFLLGDAAGEFRPVDWQDVGAEVYAERARNLTGEFPQRAGRRDRRRPAGGGRGHSAGGGGAAPRRGLRSRRRARRGRARRRRAARARGRGLDDRGRAGRARQRPPRRLRAGAARRGRATCETAT